MDNIVEGEWWGLKQLMTGADNSGILLTDFKAAFPSLFVPWLLAVLEAMGVHPAVLGFYKALYTDNTATVSFRGCTPRRFPVCRGVRQGDPASMVLFAYALDPVMRWLNYQLTPKITKQLGYADDLFFGIPDIRKHLGHVLGALEFLGPAVGLELNFGKCKVVLCGNLDGRRLSEHLRAKGVQAAAIQFCTAAVYLGFWLGPTAHQHLWAELIPKLWSRVRRLRSLGLGLPTRTWG